MRISPLDYEEIAAALEATGDYRTFSGRSSLVCAMRRMTAPPRRSVILDVETTGLDPANAEVIELGMVKFEFAADGRIFGVLDTFDELRQLEQPIPPEITNLTGLTDAAVAGL